MKQDKIRKFQPEWAVCGRGCCQQAHQTDVWDTQEVRTGAPEGPGGPLGPMGPWGKEARN